MVSGLLMGLEDHNCWTIAEAIGHRRLQRAGGVVPGVRAFGEPAWLAWIGASRLVRDLAGHPACGQLVPG
jgi:hypothetical protein